MFKNSKLRKGFSLAEVLIALTIIGVVAAITIPAIISSTTNSELNTRAQKAYSSLQKTLTTMQTNGNSGSDYYTEQAFTNDIVAIMNATKVATVNDIFVGQYKRYKNDTPYAAATRLGGTDPAFITADGMAWAFSTSGNCYPNDNFSNFDSCGIVSVDTNGTSKPPNMAGMDLLDFYIVSKGGSYTAVPYGSPVLQPGAYPDIVYSCTKNAPNMTLSRGCSYLRVINPSGLP